MSFQEIFSEYTLSDLLEALTPFLLSLLGGLIMLVVGLRVIKWTTRLFRKYLEGRIDDSLAPFLVNLLSLALKVLLGITILSTIGVETTSFAALIGSLGLAAGMALSGSLQNFASAVIIFTFKPFEVGEVIKYKDVTGTVTEIQVFSTVVQTFDKPYVFIPNQELTTNKVTNFSRNPTRRREINLGVDYNTDLKKAQKVIRTTLEKEEYILADPAVKVGVSELGENAVNLKAIYYIHSGDYMRTVLETQEQLKKALDKAGIKLPYPHLTVQMAKK